MTSDTTGPQARCSECETVLPLPGAICHVCDADAHFEGALRTAPPITDRYEGDTFRVNARLVRRATA